jgi:hypothetical protein
VPGADDIVRVHDPDLVADRDLDGFENLRQLAESG